MLAVVAVALATAGALGVGTWGVRRARATSDLFVASRAIGPWTNAAAISGEYLSAASFLGVAGLAMKYGIAALWLPVGFAGGYFALLLFVAAPLRRFGAYTIPDFVEGRLGGRRLRVVASVVVLAIGGLYLVPQLKGAGITLGEVAGAPYWVGVVVVVVVVAASAAYGGMRAVTYVQSFQFWVKLVAISLPAFLVLLAVGGLPERAALLGRELPRAPAAGLAVVVPEPTVVEFPRTTRYAVRTGVGDGVGVGAPGGRTDAEREAGAGPPEAGRERVAVAAAGERVRLPAGRLLLPPRAVVPVRAGDPVLDGRAWSAPAGGEGRSDPLFIVSLLVATLLGTMGLPHILGRFATNADGVAARRTTVRVLGLLGVFYLFPVVYAVLGRVLVPELLVDGRTDLVVLRLPAAVLDGVVGELAVATVAAGAFAAFVSAASGLAVSVAGTVAYDLLPRLRGEGDPTDSGGVARVRRRRFRGAVLAAMAVPAVVALLARGIDITVLVSWAFALAASTFCPLLLLGIWWPRLTARGAMGGLLAGGGLATAIVLAALLAGEPDGSLLLQPAIVSVPLAFAVMVLVSLRDGAPPGARVRRAMRAMHAPEGTSARIR